MTGETLASMVYAKTLFRTAREQEVVNKVLSDMVLVTDVVEKTPSLTPFLSNPVFKRDHKLAVLEQSFSKYFDALTQRFLKLLLLKDRLDLLPSVATRFIALEEESRNVLRAKVTSATPLRQKQLQAIEQKLAQTHPGKSFVMESQVDASLLGGFRIQHGDTIIDASIRNKLATLQKNLAA